MIHHFNLPRRERLRERYNALVKDEFLCGKRVERLDWDGDRKDPSYAEGANALQGLVSALPDLHRDLLNTGEYLWVIDREKTLSGRDETLRIELDTHIFLYATACRLVDIPEPRTPYHIVIHEDTGKQIVYAFETKITRANRWKFTLDNMGKYLRIQAGTFIKSRARVVYRNFDNLIFD